MKLKPTPRPSRPPIEAKNENIIEKIKNGQNGIKISSFKIIVYLH